jgi:hypothetical protein
VKKEIEDHIKIHKNCDSNMLYVNIETILMDLSTWNEDDSNGWMEIFQIIDTLHCAEGAAILTKVNEFLI